MSQTRSSWSSSVRGARRTVIDPPGPRSTFWALGAVASMVITASALSGMHLVTAAVVVPTFRRTVETVPRSRPASG